MKIDNTSTQANNPIQEFINANKEHWSAFVNDNSIDKSKCILVDMMVGHPGYLIGNAIIAKYLQKRYGVQIISIIRSKNDNLNIAISHSYNFNANILLDTKFQFKGEVKFGGDINSPNLSELRRAILGLTVNEINIGTFVYDSYLRITGKGTIEAIDEILSQIISATARNYLFFDQVCKQFNVIATVQGHTVYSDFGTMALAAINNGAAVFGRKPASGPIAIRLYRNLAELAEQETKVTPEVFNLVKEKDFDNAVKSGFGILNKRFNGVLSENETGQYTSFASNKKKPNKEKLCAQLSLDADKPLVCIMSQSFSDAPHATGHILFDDYYQWLTETLECIKDIKHINWVIKEHPYLKHYNCIHTAERLVAPYATSFSHIRFLTGDIKTTAIYDMVSAIVTCTGSAGMEATSRGVPSILAGNNYFSGLGFTYDPADKNEYFNFLKKIETLKKPTQEKINLACIAVYIYINLARVESSYMPNLPAVFWQEMNMGEIWLEAKEKLTSNSPSKDPLYQNLNQMLDRGDKKLLKYDTIVDKIEIEQAII